MNQFRLTAFALVGLAALLFAPSAQAQTGQAPMDEEFIQRHQLSGFIGLQAFDVTDEIGPVSDVEVDNQAAYGGRYEYRFRPHWGVEGGFTYSPTTGSDTFGDS